MFPGSEFKLKRAFQKGLDPDELRRKREDDRLNLRRKQRTQLFHKKRRQLRNSSAESSDIALNSTSENVDTNISDNTDGTPILNAGPKSDFTVDRFHTYVQQIMSPNSDDHILGARAIRHLLSVERDPPYDRILQSGIVLRLMHFMTDENTEMKDDNARHILKLECGWAISNLTCGESKHTRQLTRMGVINHFIKLLKQCGTDNPDLVDHALWGLGNIVADCISLRNSVLKFDVLEYLIANFENYSYAFRCSIVWIFHNFIRETPIATDNLIRLSKTLPLLKQVWKTAPDMTIRYDILWILRDYTGHDCSDDIDPVQDTIDCGFLNSVMEAIKCFRKDDRLLQPAFRYVGNVLTGTDEQTQIVLDLGFLEVADLLLDSPLPVVRREVCWALSNIAAGESEQIGYIVNNQSVLHKMIEIAKFDPTDTRREALVVLCNASATEIAEDLQILVDAGLIEAVASFLKPPLCYKESCLMRIFETLGNVLHCGNCMWPDAERNPYLDAMEECQILDECERMQTEENTPQSCCDMIVDFIQSAWGEDDDSLELDLDDTTSFARLSLVPNEMDLPFCEDNLDNFGEEKEPSVGFDDIPLDPGRTSSQFQFGINSQNNVDSQPSLFDKFAF